MIKWYSLYLKQDEDLFSRISEDLEKHNIKTILIPYEPRIIQHNKEIEYMGEGLEEIIEWWETIDEYEYYIHSSYISIYFDHRETTLISAKSTVSIYQENKAHIVPIYIDKNGEHMNREFYNFYVQYDLAFNQLLNRLKDDFVFQENWRNIKDKEKHKEYEFRLLLQALLKASKKNEWGIKRSGTKIPYGLSIEKYIDDRNSRRISIRLAPREQYVYKASFVQEYNINNLNASDFTEVISKDWQDVLSYVEEYLNGFPTISYPKGISRFTLYSFPKRNIDIQSMLNTYINTGQDESYKPLDEGNVREGIFYNKSFQYQPKEKIMIPIKKDSKRYPRSELVANNALYLANYCCEVNSNHPSFISKKKGKQYMEPHHLIPLEFTDKFDVSLDVEANVVSLCSNCHNQLHYGRDIEKILKKLYLQRREKLQVSGIQISFEELLDLYKVVQK